MKKLIFIKILSKSGEVELLPEYLKHYLRNYMRKRHIKPIAGVEVRDEDTFLYLLLARNLDGLDGIHQFLSKHVVTKKSFPVVAENLSFLTIFLMAS